MWWRIRVPINPQLLWQSADRAERKGSAFFLFHHEQPYKEPKFVKNKKLAKKRHYVEVPGQKF